MRAWIRGLGRRIGLRLTATNVHVSLAVAWAILAFPGVLLWRDSLPFLVFVSLYANFVGEISAYQAAKAERETVSNDQHENVMRELAEVRKELRSLRRARAVKA